MDAGYDALEAAASSFAKTKESNGHGDDRDRRGPRRERSRSPGRHRSDRDRDYRDRGHSDRDRDSRYRPSDRPPRREYDERDRDRPRYDDRGPPRRDHRNEFAAQPMRQYSPPRGGGGGGGRGRGRDNYRDQHQRRSPTPPGTVPIEQRKRVGSQWDKIPDGFEGLGALQAKLTGAYQFGTGTMSMDSNPYQQLTIGAPPPTFAASPVRQSKRLFVGNVTAAMEEQPLLEFFNKKMLDEKLATDAAAGDSVVSVQVNAEKGYAFLEFRNLEDATAALAFDGVVFEGVALKLRRPKDYAGMIEGVNYIPGVIGSTVADTVNKLFVGGLPTYLTDEQVIELLKSFGDLKSFNLVKEGTGETGVSKGFAFCEYLDPNVTDMAIQGLHEFQLGDRTLVVQRAMTGRGTQPYSLPGLVDSPAASFVRTAAIVAAANPDQKPTSCTIVLLNMVTPEELHNDDDYADILEDIKDECSKFGEVVGVRIPRPTPKSKKWLPQDTAVVTAAKNQQADEEAGVGRVYIKFGDLESTDKAIRALGGRQFGGRTILVANVKDEEFLGPAPPPPPPEDLDAAASAAVDDIMGSLGA